MRNKKQFFFLILFLGGFITNGFTACATRTTVPGWVEVQWENSAIYRHFPVETSIQKIKEDFELPLLGAAEIPLLGGAQENYMKVNVNHTEECNNYTLKEGDFVRAWLLLIPSTKCGRFFQKSYRDKMEERAYDEWQNDRVKNAKEREEAYNMAATAAK